MSVVIYGNNTQLDSEKKDEYKQKEKNRLEKIKKLEQLLFELESNF